MDGPLSHERFACLYCLIYAQTDFMSRVFDRDLRDLVDALGISFRQVRDQTRPCVECCQSSFDFFRVSQCRMFVYVLCPSDYRITRIMCGDCERVLLGVLRVAHIAPPGDDSDPRLLLVILRSCCV